MYAAVFGLIGALVSVFPRCVTSIIFYSIAHADCFFAHGSAFSERLTELPYYY